MAAGPAVVVGALQGQRSERGLERLRVAARVARQPTAGAGRGRARVIGAVGVEASLDGAGCQLQSLAAQVGLEGLEVEPVGGPGRYEPGDLGFDRGREFLLAGFFFTALVPGRSRDWHRSSLTAISSATSRRRRWHSAIWPLVASTSEAGMERLRVLPPTAQVSCQYGPWPGCSGLAQRQLGLPHWR